MAQTLFDRIMPPRFAGVAPETAFVLMGLDTLVFLPAEQYLQQLRGILGADTVGQLPSPAQFVPAVLFCRSGNRLILAFEGTRGIEAWWNYVAGAGVKPYGPAPGVCFAPFVDAARTLQANIGQLYELRDRVLFTGHSLGAAVAGMLNDTQTRAGWWTDMAWLFACPRFADRAYLAAAKGRNVTLNLPFDPVPYLPPDVVEIVGRSPTEIRWAELLDRYSGWWPLSGWYQAAQQASRLDWLVQLAGANVVPNVSPHQTYQYIRATYSACGSSPRPDVVQLAELLKGLGLFDPWQQRSVDRLRRQEPLGPRRLADMVRAGAGEPPF